MKMNNTDNIDHPSITTKKTESFDYYVTHNKYILDENYKYVYCMFHIDQRLKEDSKGFIICEKCNKVLKIGDLA